MSLLDFATRFPPKDTDAAYRRLQAERDTWRDFHAAGVLQEGHFSFPGGYHCTTYFSSAALANAPDADALSARLAARLSLHLDDTSFDMLVSCAQPLDSIAAHLADLHEAHCMSVITQTAPPSLLLARGELRGTRVVLLVDVLNTGALLESIAHLVECRGATVVAVLSLVNLMQYSGRLLPKLATLVHAAVDNHAPTACPACASGLPLSTIDMDLGDVVGRTVFLLTSSRAAYMNARALEPAFWDTVDQTRAFRPHLAVGGQHVSPAIDVGCILTQAPDLLRDRISSIVHRLPRCDLILINNRRPLLRRLADLFSSVYCHHTQMELRVVGVPPDPRHPITRSAYRKLRSRDALLLDVALCSGDSAVALLHRLRLLGVRRAGLLAVLDRRARTNTPVALDDFDLGVHTLFRLPLPLSVARAKADCGYCRRIALDARCDASGSRLVREYFALLRSRLKAMHARSHTGSSPDQLALSLIHGSAYVEGAAAVHEFASSGDLGGVAEALATGNASYQSAVLCSLDDRAIEDASLRRMLLGLSINSVDARVMRSVCHALARGNEFTWLTHTWIRLHSEFVATHWRLLACALQFARVHRNPAQLMRMRATLTAALNDRDLSPAARARCEEILSQE